MLKERQSFSRCTFSLLFLFSFFVNVHLFRGLQQLEKMLPRHLFSTDYIKKINISQEEYATKFHDYLVKKNNGQRLETLNLVFSEKAKGAVILAFDSNNLTNRASEVAAAEVRMLLPPVAVKTSQFVPSIIVKDSNNKVVHKQKLQLSKNESKWVNFMVTEAVKELFKNQDPVWKFEFLNLLQKPKKVYLNVIVSGFGAKRKRRQLTHEDGHAGQYEGEYEEIESEEFMTAQVEFEYDYQKFKDNVFAHPYDCQKVQKSPFKELPCCRDQVLIDAKFLNEHLSDYPSRIKPILDFVAGSNFHYTFCVGVCPSTYYQDEKKMEKGGTIIRVLKLEASEMQCFGEEGFYDDVNSVRELQNVNNICCAPKTYEDFIFLTPDEYDPTKLGLYSVKNFVITSCECA